jgi:CHASE2 domain-containing sensor protein
MAEANSPLTHGPLVHATIHWLTGVVFAILLSLALLLAGPHIPGLSDFMSAMEVKGVDAAMRVRLVAAPDSGFAGASRDPGFVFLDIDSAACEAAHGGSRCDTRSPADPALAARVATAALATDPRVVIIDVALWDDDPGAAPSASAAAMEALAAAAKAHPNTRVVAVAPFRPTGAERTGVIDWTLVPPALAKDSITFAPSFAWRGPFENDGVMRRYPSTVLMSDPTKSPTAHETPTLPYLSALYAQAADDPTRLAAVDCQYAALIGPQSIVCPTTVALPPVHPLDGGLQAGAESRILYSLPSLVPGPDGQRPFQAAQFQGRYDLYPVSAMLDDQGRLRQPVLFKDKIVIISTSALTALDHHDTPLGDMAGAEVVLNAVKAFLDGGLIREPGLDSRLEHEAVVIAASSLPYLVFWVLYFLLAARWRGSRVGMVILPLFATIGFLATVAAAMALAAVATIGPLTKGFEEGFAIEFFTPIFALSLEGFAEGARWAIDRIEHTVERFVVHAHKRLIRPKSVEGS